MEHKKGMKLCLYSGAVYCWPICLLIKSYSMVWLFKRNHISSSPILTVILLAQYYSKWSIIRCPLLNKHLS